MATLKVVLPTIQNWSCHNCSGCCRQHAIEITDEERQRIVDQNWTAADGIPADQPVVVPSGGLLHRDHRLAHRPDGACVFLDDNGLCRIHAKFGEAAKPLACRVYPFAFHPSGKSLRVSLRFSCPSVVKNLGKPTSERNRELRNLADAVVPDRFVEPDPPPIHPGQRVDWKDFEKFVNRLDRFFAEGKASFAVRLLQALHWVDMIGQAKLGALQGVRIAEFLDLIAQSTILEVPDELPPTGPIGRLGGVHFRLLAAQYSRKDTFAADRSLRARWKLLRAMWRFARGRGDIPVLQDAFKSVPFSTLENSFGPLPSDAEEIFNRYFRVKILGLHFCGLAYYNVPFVEGFQSLTLMFPVVMYLARWLAAGDGRAALTTDDIITAITIADHHHGYSPAFGFRAFRRRVRFLAGSGELAKLCTKFAQ